MVQPDIFTNVFSMFKNALVGIYYAFFEFLISIPSWIWYILLAIVLAVGCWLVYWMITNIDEWKRRM